MAETQTTAEQLDRLYHLCGVLQRYHESWLRLEDSKRALEGARHLYFHEMASTNEQHARLNEAGIPIEDRSAQFENRSARLEKLEEMVQRLDSAIENWTPLVNEFFRLAILNSFDIMSPAFGQIEVTMQMPHRIGSFDWQAFSSELRSVRHKVMRRRAELIVNVAPSLVTLGDHPQIVLGDDGDNQAIALKYETAVWLKALIDCGDWMSGPEFNRQHPELGGNVRADRLEIPAVVKKHVDSQTGKGSRWLP